MIQVKETDKKISAKKKVITVKDVHIDDSGNFVDENGSIGTQILPEIPNNEDVFTFKITFELPDEDEEDQPF